MQGEFTPTDDTSICPNLNDSTFVSQSVHPLAPKFDRLFRGRRNAYGTYDLSNVTIASDGKLKGSAQTKRLPSAEDETWLRLWTDHLLGKQPGLGVFPICETGTCHWGCIDVDCKFAIDPRTLAQKVGALSLPLITCNSKSKNASHTYFFSKKPLPALMMRETMEDFRNQLSLPKEVEVFPNIAVDTDAELPGGWVSMPYFGLTRTGISL